MINKRARLNLIAGLSATLLSTTAMATIGPGDAGVALAILPRGPAPQVETLRQMGLAGRRFEANDRVLELLFTDGTSLALAPGGALTVESYAFDPSAGTGELRVRLDRNTLRVSGGRLNTVEPIVIDTPAGVAELNDGGGTVEVDAEGRTYASLLYGEALRLTANGETVELFRPGFGSEAAPGEAPSSPRRRPLSRTESVALALNPGLAPGEEPAAGPETIEPSVESELAGEQPSDAELVTMALDLEESEAEATSEERRADAAANARDFQSDLSTTGDVAAGTPTFGVGAVGAAGGFGAGTTVGAIGLADTLPTIAQGGGRSLSQGTDPRLPEGVVPTVDDDTGSVTPGPRARPMGLTTNRIFNNVEAGTVDFSDARLPANRMPREMEDSDVAPLQYLFASEAGIPGFLIIGDENDVQATTFLGSQSAGVFGVLFLNEELPEDGARNVFVSPRGLGSADTSGSMFGDSYVAVLQSGFAKLKLGELEGTIWDGYQAVLAEQGLAENDDAVFDRQSDNFLIVEAAPLDVLETRRDQLKKQFDLDEVRTDDDARARFISALFEPIDIALPTDEDTEEKIAEIVLGSGDVKELESLGFGIRLEGEVTRVTDFRLQPDPDRPERFYFAAGDVDGGPDCERRLDTFFLSPGLEGFEEKNIADAKVASAIRAFLRNVTSFRNEDGTGGLDLADTGLLVIGSPANSRQTTFRQGGGDEQTGLIHVDFGIEGQGADQRSTISATIGEVVYGVNGGIPGFENDDAENEVVLSARTIGSSRAKSAEGSVLVDRL